MFRNFVAALAVSCVLSAPAFAKDKRDQMFDHAVDILGPTFDGVVVLCASPSIMDEIIEAGKVGPKVLDEAIKQNNCMEFENSFVLEAVYNEAFYQWTEKFAAESWFATRVTDQQGVPYYAVVGITYE